MKYAEFVAEVVRRVPGSTSTVETILDRQSREGNLLDVDQLGSGMARNYTERHVRILVAWLRLRLIAGESHPGIFGLRRQAARLAGDYNHGWIVISDRVVWWEPEPYSMDLLTAAVFIPCGESPPFKTVA